MENALKIKCPFIDKFYWNSVQITQFDCIWATRVFLSVFPMKWMLRIEGIAFVGVKKEQKDFQKMIISAFRTLDRRKFIGKLAANPSAACEKEALFHSQAWNVAENRLSWILFLSLSLSLFCLLKMHKQTTMFGSNNRKSRKKKRDRGI